MNNDETFLVITKFISALSWQLVGVMFLCSSIVLYFINGYYNPFVWTFVILFIWCSAISIKRKAEVLKEYDEY